MKTSISYRQIWNIAYPIILGSIAQNIINVTDTAFLGRVGEVELGASAIGGVFYFVLITLGFGFGIGTQIIVARRVGEKRIKEIGKTIEHTLVILLILATALFFLSRFFFPGVLKTFMSSQDVYASTVKFLNFRIWGIFFAYINIAFSSFYVGIAKTKVITYSSIISSGLNIILGYCLIFGKAGFPKMGIEGAALASSISETLATSFYILYTLKMIPLKKYRLFYFTKWSAPLLRRILKVSLPLMLQFSLSFISWFIFFIIIESMGEHPLAISNIIRSVYVLLMVPIWGLAAAASTLISNIIGQKKPDEVIGTLVKVIKLTLLFMIPLTLVIWIFPMQVLSIYTNDPILISDSLASLYVVSSVLVFISTGVVMFNAVFGIGITYVPLIIEIIVLSMYLFYTNLVANVLKCSISVVWSSELVYAFLIGLFSFLYLKFGNWKKYKI